MTTLADIPQDFVLWRAASRLRADGLPSLGSAEALKGRWDVARGRRGGGNKDTPKVVARLFVDEAVAKESLIWKGKLEDLPDSPTELFQVAEYVEIEGLLSGEYTRYLELIFFGNSLPA